MFDHLLPDPEVDPRPLLDRLSGRRLALLAGAGVSTESGIPDYRGPIGRTRPRHPIRYLDFVSKPHMRQRYWARSAVGWPKMRASTPNACHHALARLEAANLTTGLITQNVDSLHQAAGHREVLELHGALDRVLCLACGERTPRAALQQRLLADNPGFAAHDAVVAPDGDAVLPDALIASFVVPPCETCGGVLKPDVIFFGENVPRARVDDAWAIVNAADALLVVGSSLTVWSGYRFVRGARERGVDVVIIGLGETRGDADACMKVEAKLGRILPALAEALPSRAPASP